MPAPTKAHRAHSIGIAASKDLNDHLTVVVGVAALLLKRIPMEDPLWPMAARLQAAAQRCATVSTGLMNHSHRNGAKATPGTMAELIEAESV